MNPALATVLLVLLAGILFVLPLLPALIELRLKRDAQPLNVIQQYAGEIRHFSYGFRNYIAALLEPLQECVASGATAKGTMPDGDEYLLLGRANERAFCVRREQKQRTASRSWLRAWMWFFPMELLSPKRSMPQGNSPAEKRMCSGRFSERKTFTWGGPARLSGGRTPSVHFELNTTAICTGVSPPIARFSWNPAAPSSG